MITAWTKDMGTRQGRITPIGFSVPEGVKAFAIGQDIPGVLEFLEVGNKCTVSQRALKHSAQFVRFRGKVRPPSAPPAGITWRASIDINGTRLMEHVLVPGWPRVLNDWGVSLAHFSGMMTLAFTLEMLGTSGIFEVEMPCFYIDAVSLVPYP